tara:strand:- start:106 stop:480 length:375 start_codon:yes stop_codon:yes gene_type:complete
MQNYYGVYQNKMSREKINIDQFNKLKLLVGTIEKAENFPEAKKLAYKLYINFGSYGKKWSSAQITENYKIDELNGMQIIAAVNLGNKKIGKFTSEVLVMGVDDNNSNVLLLQPDKKIQNGAQVN